jgi:transcriptional regulator with XRE-family HTH domain
MSTERKPARRVLYHEVLGAYLRQLRQERELSISQIAAPFEVSEALLSKIENGRRGPSPATLALYCEVLDMPLLELLADVAKRHREMVDPFDPLLRVKLPTYVRILDGLALYAGVPGRHMPKSLYSRIKSVDQQKTR